MEYKETQKYRFLNEDREVKGWCWEVSIKDARIKLETRIADGEGHLKGCIVSEPYDKTQSDYNKTYKTKQGKDSGIISVTVTMHKKAKKKVMAVALADLVERGLR